MLYLPPSTLSHCSPFLKVYVHITDTELIIGFPIFRKPLSQRIFLNRSGLRSTICWCLCHLANISPGDIVIDPMCGVGTVVVQGAVSFPCTEFMGVDWSKEQVCATTANIKRAGVSARAQAVQADARGLPFGDDRFTAAVCDLPFNRSHKVCGDMPQTYEAVLAELSRVVRGGGHAAVLVERLHLLEQVLKGRWSIGSVHPIALGELDAFLVLLINTKDEKMKRRRIIGPIGVHEATDIGHSDETEKGEIKASINDALEK